MDTDEIFDAVKSIIVEQLGVSEASVTTDASFIDDLGADSLDIVELVMALEEEFDIEIPDADAEKVVTVGDVVEYTIYRYYHPLIMAKHDVKLTASRTTVIGYYG